MTEQPTPPHGAGESPPGTAEQPHGAAEGSHAGSERQGAAESLSTLRRSRDERVLAGVLGGLAQRLGVDPVLLRIVTVVLAVFGGVGIVLYAAGWLLIPDDGTDRSVAEQALGRSNDRAEPATLWLAGGLVLAVLFSAGATFGSGVGTVLLVLAGTGVIVLLRRDGDAPDGRFTDRAEVEAPAGRFTDRAAGDEVTGSAPDDAAARAADTSQDAGRVPSGGDATAADTAAEDPATDSGAHSVEPPAHDPGSRPPYVHSFTAPVQSASAWPEPPDWPAADFDPVGYETSEPAAASRPAGSHLGALTMSAVAVALGVLAINDAAFAVVPASAYVALALAVIGGGLLIGTWFGRARGLIAWGLIGVFIALPATAIGDFLDWDLTGEDRTITIDDVAELPGDPRSHGMGRVMYDLGDLDVTDADEPLTLDVTQNVGALQIVVPPEVDVTVNAATGMGHIVAFDEQAGGHQDITVTDSGPDGAGGGELTLDLRVELGEITVERSGSPTGDINGQGVPR